MAKAAQGESPNRRSTMTGTSSRGERTTKLVSKELFQQVYDSPASLPGKERWVTVDQDVREIEKVLGMEPNTIGAPLWLSGDTRHCPKCDRETSWLDIVGSALSDVHNRRMLAEVILGERKFVNIEAPRAIADLKCYGCGTDITDLRSFKCHNWAYAVGKLREVIRGLPE
jgi:hypothetical protein